jgi:hypothetical protein
MWIFYHSCPQRSPEMPAPHGQYPCRRRHRCHRSQCPSTRRAFFPHAIRHSQCIASHFHVDVSHPICSHRHGGGWYYCGWQSQQRQWQCRGREISGSPDIDGGKSAGVSPFSAATPATPGAQRSVETCPGRIAVSVRAAVVWAIIIGVTAAVWAGHGGCGGP